MPRLIARQCATVAKTTRTDILFCFAAARRAGVSIAVEMDGSCILRRMIRGRSAAPRHVCVTGTLRLSVCPI